jgi:hypothetical protein
MENLAKNGLDKNGNAASEAAQAAAMKKLASTGDIARIHSLLKSLEEMERSKNGMMRRALADGIDKSGASNHAVHLGGSATDALRNGSIFQPDTSMPAAADNVLNRMYANANNNGLYNASSIASQSAHSLEGLRTAMGDGAINTQQSNTIRDTASKVKESSRLTTRMSNSAQRELTRF